MDVAFDGVGAIAIESGRKRLGNVLGQHESSCDFQQILNGRRTGIPFPDSDRAPAYR
jgi:hypothetical protein